MPAFALPLIAAALGIGVNVNQSRKGKRAKEALQATRDENIGLLESAIGEEQGPLTGPLGSADPKLQGAAISEAQRRAQARRDQPTADLDLKLKQSALRTAGITESENQLRLDQAQGIGLSPDRLSATADMLFDDRQKEMAPFKTQLASFDQLMGIIDTESGPASMAVLFKFIKSMDDSVVRASEGQLLSSSSGPIRELVNAFNKLAGGGLFDKTTRAEIKQAATQLAQSSFNTAKAVSTDHDKRLANFSREFQSPALQRIGGGVGFDAGRTFGEVDVPARASGETGGFVVIDGKKFPIED